MTDQTPSIPSDADAPLDDRDLTTKDRSYSPSSDRETAERQASGPEDTHSDASQEGVQQLPGTGGPDDSGDTTVPDDEIDAATIVERSNPDAAPQR
jgi:hypothetical protein